MTQGREDILGEALRWALAELNGATRYDNDEQRENCFADAEAALAKGGLAEATAPWRQWYDAIDEALVCAHLGTAESFPDAKTALHKLICWEIDVALNPAVSERARELAAGQHEEIARLRNSAEDAIAALPVLITMLKTAGLSDGANVAIAMLEASRAALTETPNG